MKYEGYLIDLDGTAYLGSEKIPTARDFVNCLKEQGKSFLFLSNNSSKTQEDVVMKLTQHGYKVGPENVYTSAMATAKYLADNYYQKKVYVIGDVGLRSELKKIDIELVNDINCDVVVVGYDSKLDYEMLTVATLAISNGADFISTNPDRALPSERGMVLGNGAITAAIEYATNKEALYIGKPSSIIMNYAIEELAIPADKIVMIGDNYDTDIMSGIVAKLDTIHVETGLTTASEVQTKAVAPTIMVKDLSYLQADI